MTPEPPIDPDAEDAFANRLDGGEPTLPRSTAADPSAEGGPKEGAPGGAGDLLPPAADVPRGTPAPIQLEVHRTQPAQAAEQQIGMLLQLAVEKDISVEKLEKLVALHERITAASAAREFTYAMASFQEKCPAIPKVTKASINPKSGAKFSYRYAPLDKIADVIRPLLHSLGLSYSWDSSIDSNMLKCVCYVRHVNGHCASATFEAPLENTVHTQSMSGPQRHANALTYAKRQSLVQVLGLTTTEPDTDAAPSLTISDHQAANLRALLDEIGDGDGRFLAWLEVERVEDIPAPMYKPALRQLEAKRRQHE